MASGATVIFLGSCFFATMPHRQTEMNADAAKPSIDVRNDGPQGPGAKPGGAAVLLVLILEGIFLFVYVFNLDRVRQSKAIALGSASVYFVFLVQLIAVNAKMGLISMYLRQMEAYMGGLGYVGVVWESKAIDLIIFRLGNAFTISAGLTILCSSRSRFLWSIA